MHSICDEEDLIEELDIEEESPLKKNEPGHNSSTGKASTHHKNDTVYHKILSTLHHTSIIQHFQHHERSIEKNNSCVFS
jgi:hypothetical protein